MGSEWQDIATAPRDGTRVLVCYQTNVGSRICIGRWDDDKYASKPRPMWDSEIVGTWGRIVARKNPPTHWMPLPAAPQETGGG